jgi:hypothetical protein
MIVYVLVDFEISFQSVGMSKVSNFGILEFTSNRRLGQEKCFDKMNIDYSDFEDYEGTYEKIFVVIPEL